MKEQLYKTLKKLLVSNNIHVNHQELNLQLLSHPSYPSLHALTGVLEHFKVDNIALRLPVNKETIKELPSSFIAHVKLQGKSDLLFVENKNGLFKITYEKDKTKLLAQEEFMSLWDGVIVVVEKDENTTTAKQAKFLVGLNYIFRFLLLVILAILVYSRAELFSIIHFMLSIGGLILSISIINHELGVQSAIVNNICNSTEQTSCDAVLNSNGANFFGILSLSDLSIITFATYTLTWLLFFISNTSVFAPIIILTLAALPFTIYSLYYQYVVVKKWCPLCLGIVAILILQSGSLYLVDFSTKFIDFESSLIFLFSFLVVIVFGRFVLHTFKKQKALEKTELDYYKFKRKFSVFNALYSKSESFPILPIIDGEIVLGNKNALLEIVIITNPLCYFCKKAHRDVESLLKDAADKIKVIIRFNIDPSLKDNKTYQIASELLHIYNTKGTASCREALKEVYGENIDFQKWLQDQQKGEKDYDEILTAQHNWCLTNDFNFTPILLLDGHRYPVEYDKSDLIYFIDDLIDNKTLT